MGQDWCQATGTEDWKRQMLQIEAGKESKNPFALIAKGRVL